MVTTRRRARATTTAMTETGNSVPLADIRETDIDDGLDSGFTGGVDDGLEGGPGNGGVVPRFGGERPSAAGGGGRGYFPVHNPGSAPRNPSGGKVPLDINLYATKKTVAQGMMDLALLTANANQLRYVLASHTGGSMYYYVNIVLISFSIIMQVFIGIALIFLGRYNVSHDTHARKADILNNWIVLGVFLITVVNVFVSAFGIDPYEGMNPALLREEVERNGLG